jgi:putative spermidine/putrescine transport system permease protein
MEEEKLTAARLTLWVFCGLVVVFLIAPILIIVIASFSGSSRMEFPPQSWSLHLYERFFTSRHWIDPALLSLRVALITTVSATVLGTLAAIGIVRGRFPGRRALEFFLVSPIVMPIIVLAVGLYFLFSAFQIVGRPISLYLGHTVLATPLVIIIVSAALRTADPTLELAARSLGASYLRTLWHITIPVIRPALFGGAAFAFLVSFDELVIAIFVGGPAATTLPKRMWDSIRFEIDPTLTAISTMLVLIAVLTLGSAEVVRRAVARRSGAVPRAGVTAPERGLSNKDRT